MLLPLLIAATSPADLIARFQCARCHEGLGEPARLESHCTHCHDAIQAGTWNAPKELMDSWRPNLVSLREVPSLADLTGFRAEWVAAFLESPVDVRPNLRGMMPRFPIRREEARAIASHLATPSGSKAHWSDDQIERGRSLFFELDCGACHAFGGVLPPRPEPGIDALRSMSRAAMLAPDLRFTRDRLDPSFVVRFIVNPSAAREGADMPSFDLDPARAEALAAFVLATRIDRIEPGPLPDRLPVLERRVTFVEVQREVFGKACQHCHANPEKSFNDGGPGNTGGFGYTGKGLSLASYREVMSGSKTDDGGRASLFKRGADGTPKIIAHLLARRLELRGDTVPEIIGMPMGLLPLSPEQIQLVETWIAQGRPE